MADQLAPGRAARHDGAMAGLQRAGRRLHVEAQPALALPFVRTVALEAPVRQERLDVEVEVDDRAHRRRRRLPVAGGDAEPRLRTRTDAPGAPEDAGPQQWLHGTGIMRRAVRRKWLDPGVRRARRRGADLSSRLGC